MTEDEMNRYGRLHYKFMRATGVCDPVEFTNRQKELLWELAQFLLYPYLESPKEKDE